MNIVRLAEIAEINPRLTNRSVDPITTVSFVPMAAISERSGSIVIEDERPLLEVMKAFTVFQNEDVLVAKITPCFENGKIAHVKIRNPLGFGSTEFHVIRANRTVLNSRYLYYFLRQRRIRVEGQKKMTGSAGQRRVPRSFIENLRIPLPSLDEQKRIAELLDTAETLREKRRHSVEKLHSLLQSVFFDMFGNPIRNSKNWAIQTLGGVVTEKGAIVDGPFGSSLKPDAYVAQGVRVIRNFNIKDDEFDTSEFRYVTESKFSEISRSEVLPGDVLISTKGTIGNICLMPELNGKSVLSATGTVRLRLSKESDIDSEFLVSQMTFPGFKKYIRTLQAGSNQKYLNLAAIRKIQVFIPPKEIQIRFSNIKRSIKESIKSMDQSRNVAEQLFLSIQQRAFDADIGHRPVSGDTA